MNERMPNPAQVLPDAMKAILNLNKAIGKADMPEYVMELVHLRASQINGCGVCVYGGVHSAKKSGETDDRLHSVAAWRESPFFSDAERSALELSEAMTRMADRPDAVSDEVWDAAAKHFSQEQLAALVLHIATTNLFNRLNATTRQQAGQTW
ncbi:MAG TPA: carboxymuconolactone decarboxylase family protein [Stackebrandtia sp.]|uniref:carboxymuconolactone decarboxylase family protein n=1 Tax=Stackebrandtia sp. TaxID=2023065 RepID=UPI002D41DD9E|nr:carboxymuconolactone decarboxylase family protein [Stackebrandtia sp.]HZE40348.1 carboxymuconolactone decarboxylase family protein [Stackebrandtia sp.]